MYSDGLLCLADEPSARPDKQFDDTAFFDAAGMVYNAGGFAPSQLSTPEARRLIAETLKQINRAISSGISYEVPETLRHALENNAFIFSGFKAYHTLREVGLSLTTDTGEIKPFEQFRRDVEKVNNQYNHNYLYAEYNHAVSAAQSAARWQRFEADGDRYDLQYRTAGDDHVRENHRALDKITLPPSDPFWEKYLPPNGWSCRCTTVQVRKGKYPRTDHALAMLRGDNCTEAAKQQIFRFNPGKTLELFPPKHPYFKAPAEVKRTIEDLNAQQEAEYMRRRVKEIREYMAEHLADPLVNEGLEAPANMSSRSVKEFTNQPHKHKREKNELLMNIQRVFKSARYLGINSTYKLRGLVASHILEIEVCGEPSWLVVREYDDGSFKLYSCSDNPKIATGLIQRKKP